MVRDGSSETISLSAAQRFIVDNRGKTPPTTETGIPLIATNCVTNDHLYPLREKLRYVSQDTYDSWFRAHPEPGDILITNKGSQNGAICLVPAPVDFVIAQDMVAVRPNEEVIDSLFLFAALRSRGVQHQIKNLDVSGVIPHFKKSDFDKLLLPYPDRDVQEAIGRIYFDLCAKIELNRRMNETLEATARAIFKSWFVDYDPVRAKMDGRHPAGMDAATAALFPDAFAQSEAGLVPVGWQIARFENCIEAKKGLSYKGAGLSEVGFPLHNLNSVLEGGGYKFEGIKHYVGEYKDRHIVRPGDVIVANTEQGHDCLLIGYAAIVPRIFGATGLFSHHLYRVRPKKRFQLSAEFLCQLLNSRKMHDVVSGYSNGTTVNMLPVDALQKPGFVLPSKRVIARFTETAMPIRERSERFVKENRTLARLRDTLLPKLLSGELRVPDAETLVGEAL